MCNDRGGRGLLLTDKYRRTGDVVLRNTKVLRWCGTDNQGKTGANWD